ncbi:hypothetical protein C8R45DRAFT_944955 [Mycena sanguinolenta]|nr:hypothetical protein C8R45DRAFT_944955 [Mycena sanguinolenta]
MACSRKLALNLTGHMPPNSCTQILLKENLDIVALNARSLIQLSLMRSVKATALIRRPSTSRHKPQAKPHKPVPANSNSAKRRKPFWQASRLTLCLRQFTASAQQHTRLSLSPSFRSPYVDLAWLEQAARKPHEGAWFGINILAEPQQPEIDIKKDHKDG